MWYDSAGPMYKGITAAREDRNKWQAQAIENAMREAQMQNLVDQLAMEQSRLQQGADQDSARNQLGWAQLQQQKELAQMGDQSALARLMQQQAFQGQQGGLDRESAMVRSRMQQDEGNLDRQSALERLKMQLEADYYNNATRNVLFGKQGQDPRQSILGELMPNAKPEDVMGLGDSIVRQKGWGPWGMLPREKDIPIAEKLEALLQFSPFLMPRQQ